jgi:hypothetical protein
MRDKEKPMWRATWLVIAWTAFGCAKPTVTNQPPPDGGPNGEDAAMQAPPDSAFPLRLDVRSDDATPGQGDGACSRTVSLRGVTIARPVPFDVVIVADNSDSLSWSRDSLSAGLANLLSRGP